MSNDLKFVLEDAEKQWVKARQIDAWMDGRFKDPYVPSCTESEYNELAKRCVANMLPLVVDLVSQSLFVEGHRTSDGGSAGWDMWDRERMGARQSPIHRAAFTFGHCLVQVLPDKTGRWRIRGLSPKSSYAMWDDPVQDEWPQVVVWKQPVPRSDEEYVWWVDDTRAVLYRGKYGNYRVVRSQEHGVGVCPVVRFADHVGLDGETPSHIEQLVPGQERLNQTIFDLLMTQTFSSFKVKTLTGVMPPTEVPLPGEPGYDPDKHADGAGARREMERYKLKIAQDRILVANDPEAKFGELSETNLAGFISAVELAIRQVATLSQTPPHALIGSMSNLSAEALAAAESGLNRKIIELQHAYGESWEQVLRLCSAVQGDRAGAADMGAKVMWRDTSAKSLSQAVDAWGKAVQMLGIAPQVVWRKIPGITQADIDDATEAMRADPMSKIAEQLNGETMLLDKELDHVLDTGSAGPGERVSG